MPEVKNTDEAMSLRGVGLGGDQKRMLSHKFSGGVGSRLG